jgi:hypothetical protein
VTTIAPGATGEVAVTLAAGIPAGPWTAQLALASGLVAHATTADVTFPDAGTATAVQKETGPDPVLLIGVAAAVLALLVAIVVLLLLRRRRRAGRVARPRGRATRLPPASAGPHPISGGRAPAGGRTPRRA